jgi:hypothetical protein
LNGDVIRPQNIPHLYGVALPVSIKESFGCRILVGKPRLEKEEKPQ